MRLLHFLTLFIIPAITIAQSSGLPLNFNSYAIRLSVAKDESLALTTKAGEIGLADSIKGDWHRIDVTKEEFNFGKTFEHSNFFNKDTGFVSGFIVSKNRKYDVIYHTTNGGQNWQEVNFGQDGWVDDAINLDNGEAWLSVAGSGIAYTNDYAFTWEKLENPERKQRFTAIFFNTQREGIAGSLWNMIAYTGDNCKTWKLLPTPLDQGKYDKTNKSSRPEFNHVAIFKSYFLAKQEDLVFYSKRDSVNWIWLPDYNNFYTDPENSTLFFITNKGRYIRSDSNLGPIHVFEDQAVGYDMKCKNGSLFIVSTDKMVQLNMQDQVISSLFVATAAVGIEPIAIGYSRNGTIGALDNKIFVQQDYKGAWDYQFTFPFSLEKGALSFVNERSLMYDRGDDTIFYFNLSGVLERTECKSSMILNFGKSGINKIVFSQGSRGCFHNYADQLAYTNLGGEFGGALEINHDARDPIGMPENDQEISEDDVLEFVRKLPIIFDPAKKASIDDLAFTPQEYEQCKKDILAFHSSMQKKKGGKETNFTFYKNNIDFNRLLSLVDSIPNINPVTLNLSLMALSERWSTTTNWIKIELINNENEVLSVASNYYEPNAFYFPWIVSLNGYHICTTNMTINRFIEKVYPAFLNKGKRIDVLHTLVKNMY